MSGKNLPLWRLLLNAISERPRRLTCEECFALMAHFADLLMQGQRASEVGRRAKRHLRHCPECREHHERRLQAL